MARCQTEVWPPEETGLLVRPRPHGGIVAPARGFRMAAGLAANRPTPSRFLPDGGDRCGGCRQRSGCRVAFPRWRGADWKALIGRCRTWGGLLLPRAMDRSVSCTRSQVPSSDHLRKYLYNVCQGGKSWGAIRHGQPERSTYRVPLTTSLRSTVRWRPPGLACGSSGYRISHCSPLRSLGYGLRFIQAVYDIHLYFGNTLLPATRR